MVAAREAVLAHPAAAPAMLLVILGCFTKPAQFPFHAWLPNAMAAILGPPAEAPLKLWHGFTPVLARSIATVALAMLILLSWARMMPRLRGLQVLDRISPKRGHERALAGLVARAEGTTRAVQHGSCGAACGRRGWLRLWRRWRCGARG